MCWWTDTGMTTKAPACRLSGHADQTQKKIENWRKKIKIESWQNLALKAAGLPLVVDKDARLSGYADTADRAGSNSLSIGIVLVWPNLTSIVCSSGL